MLPANHPNPIPKPRRIDYSTFCRLKCECLWPRVGQSRLMQIRWGKKHPSHLSLTGRTRRNEKQRLPRVFHSYATTLNKNVCNFWPFEVLNNSQLQASYFPPITNSSNDIINLIHSNNFSQKYNHYSYSHQCAIFEALSVVSLISRRIAEFGPLKLTASTRRHFSIGMLLPLVGLLSDWA